MSFSNCAKFATELLEIAFRRFGRHRNKVALSEVKSTLMADQRLSWDWPSSGQKVECVRADYGPTGGERDAGMHVQDVRPHLFLAPVFSPRFSPRCVM